ncbi:lysozyme inhibitor LprI family protein [Roseibium sp.]|uniref:lysozyme inhibitor LprI family protein n=1 Tax=Roseibium sp. TaxID=1936156 RepID=UPI003B504BC3
MRFLVVGPAVVAFGGPFAPAIQAQDVNCKEPQTQLDMTICAKKDWEAADVELNAAYKSAMAAMKQTDSYLSDDLKVAAETLKAAQRAWIPFRDKACESYGFLARGGSMEPMLVLQCRADLTRQRTSELKDLTQGLGN